MDISLDFTSLLIIFSHLELMIYKTTDFLSFFYIFPIFHSQMASEQIKQVIDETIASYDEQLRAISLQVS